jgi:N utilization substance protein A
MFMDTLDVDETIAQLLVTEGFSKVEEIADAEIRELANIEGFDDDVGGELQARALTYIEKRNAELNEERLSLGVTDEVAAFEVLTPQMLVTLGKNGVKTLDDLGDLAGDELIEMLPEAGLSEDEANTIIMAARAHWFDDAPAEGAPA